MFYILDSADMYDLHRYFEKLQQRMLVFLSFEDGQKLHLERLLVVNNRFFTSHNSS